MLVLFRPLCVRFGWVLMALTIRENYQMTLSDPIVGSLFITWWGGMILVVLQQKLPDPPSPEGYVVY